MNRVPSAIAFFPRALALSLVWLLISPCSQDNGVEDNGKSLTHPNVVLQADNPKIETIVAQIAQDSLQATIDRLVEFFTRHTNSDTISDTRGIGAARRWVFAKFKEISNRSGGRLEVSYHNFQATIRGVTGFHRNVIAELPGTTHPERKFIVSGHLDSRNADIDDATNRAPGANDDGSGVAAILELARVFSQFTFESTVMFVAFTGEEEGLFGSRALAADLKANNVNVVGMVTNDIIGNVVGGSGQVDSLSVRCFSDNPSDSRNRQLARYMKLQGEAYLPGFTVRLIARRDRPGRGGDHFAFNEQGYTAARLTEPEDNLNHQHNMNDLPEFMSYPYLTNVVKVNAAYLASWADAPETPMNVALAPEGRQQLLSWDKIAEAGLTYLVAFRGPGSASYDSLVAVGAETRVALDPATLPDGVFISVSGVDAEGNESVFSQEVVLRK